MCSRLYGMPPEQWVITRAEMIAWNAIFTNVEIFSGEMKFSKPDELYQRPDWIPCLFSFLRDHSIPDVDLLPEQRMSSAELLSKLFVMSHDELVAFAHRVRDVMKKCEYRAARDVFRMCSSECVCHQAAYMSLLERPVNASVKSQTASTPAADTIRIAELNNELESLKLAHAAEIAAVHEQYENHVLLRDF